MFTMALAAFALAGLLGLAATGCDDDTGSVAPVLDLSVTSHPDMTTKGG
jgi:hypothetical protein